MAINLGRWFRDRKKQAEGVVAQANPFDGGKTYNTVINNTPVAKPVQTQVNTAQPGWSVRTQPTQPSWLQKQNDFNTSLSAITAPKPQVAQTPKAQEPNLLQQRIDKSYGTGFTATKNRLRDVLDGNTEADRIRRMANTGLNESYKQQQDRLTQVAINSSPKRSGANQFSAGALSGVTDFFGKAAGSAAELQGRIGSIENPIARTAVKLVTPGGAATLFQSKDQAKRQFNTGKQMNEFVENKKQQSGIGARKDDNKWLYGGGQVAGQLPAQIATGGVGLLNTGAQMAASEANKAQAKGKTNEQALGIGLAQGALSAASEKFGIDRFLPGSGGSNAIINAIKRFGTEGLQEAQQQFTQNLVANKTYDPTQSLKEGVGESFVLGGVAGSAMSPFADIGVNNKPQRPEYSPTPQNIQNAPKLNTGGYIGVGSDSNNIQTGDQVVTDLNIKQDPTYQTLDKRAYEALKNADESTGALKQNYQVEAAELIRQRNEYVENAKAMTAPVQQQSTVGGMIARMRAAKARIKPLDNKGFIAGPLALDFSKAQAEGKVFKGVDGKPRFEVSDEGAKLNTDAFNPTNRLTNLEAQYGMMLQMKKLGVDNPDIDARLKTIPEEIRQAKKAATSSKNLKLSDVLDHEQMYAQYPDLKDVKVKVVNNRGFETLAAYNARTNTVEVNKKRLDTDPEKVKATILHEVQHAIQEKEGFASGGYDKNMDTYNRLAGEAEARAVQARMDMPMSERYVKPEGRTLYHGSPVADTIKQDGFKSGKGNALLGEGVYLTPSRNKAGNYTIPRDYDYSKPITEEMRNKGIIEAKIAQNAKIFTPKTRAELKTPDTNYGDPKLITEKFKKLGYDGIELNGEVVIFDPSKVSVAGNPRSTFYDSLDVPKEDLIVRNEGGKAMSVDPLESLKQEARKYKSAEEFVKAQGEPVYHGTTEKIQGDFRYPLYTTPKKDYAQVFADSTAASSISKSGKKLSDAPMVHEFAVNPKARVLDITNPAHRKLLEEQYFGKYSMSYDPVVGKNGHIDWTEGENLAEWIEETKQPFDAIRLDEGGGGIDPSSGLPVIDKGVSYLALNKNALKSKSQLTDLYNQATQPPKSTPAPKAPKPVEKTPTYYHGTRADNDFDKFDFKKSGTSIAGDYGNNVHQGNVAYFTKNKDSASIFAREATDRYDMGVDFESFIKRKTHIKDGNVLEFKPAKDAKIKKLDHRPDLAETNKLKQQGYDGVEFDDKEAWTGFSEGRWRVPEDTTTVAVWNTDKLERVKATQPPKSTQAKPPTPNESTKRPIKPAPAKPLSVVDRVNSINETPKAPTKDKVLASLEKQKRDLIDYEARARYETGKEIAQKQKELRKTIKDQWTGQTDIEDLPRSIKGGKLQGSWAGKSFDELAHDLGFESDSALADELFTHTTQEKLSDLREVVEDTIKRGDSPLSDNYKKLLQEIDDRQAELLRYPEGARALENKPSPKMSKAERESLHASAPVGTERKLKVATPVANKNIPVRKLTQEGDVVTATNVNPDIKATEKRYSIDDNGQMIEDRKGAYRIFNDGEGKITGVRIGKKYYSAKELGDLSDVNDYGSSLATMRRNIERAFGKETGDKLSKFVVDHQQKQATKLIRRQLELKQGTDALAKELGISFGIGRRRAKKVSASIQDYGEGNITRQDLVSQYGENMAGKIVEADKWFKSQYNQLLDEMNKTLTTYGYDPVQKHKNYYTHFQDQSLWSKVGLKMQEIRSLSSPTMQDSMPAPIRGSIDNRLAGQSEFMTPNKRFNPFALQRKGDAHTSDAFQSFERYLTPTLNNIYMTPSITRARVVSQAVAEQANLAGKDANGVIRQMREWANRLAGKTSRIDRPLVDSKWGNTALRASQWAQRKAGANTIVGNLSTAVMQPVVLTQTIGKFGLKNTLLATVQEMSTAHSKFAPIRKSEFMTRRYADLAPTTSGKIDRAAVIANTPLEVVEETASRITWNAAHNDALSKGIRGDAAIKYADVQAEKTLSGRSIGERPELFDAKAPGIFTMYQLEVNNYWQQVGKEMTKAQAARTMAAGYAFNLLMGAINGRSVGFNPIDAILDSIGMLDDEDEDNVAKAKRIAQRLGGELVDSLPFVGAVGTIVMGEQGWKDLMGKDSTSGRFGFSNALRTLYENPGMLITPFGYNQARKTIQGLETWLKGQLESKSGKKLTDVPQTKTNLAKALAFGKSAISEVSEYYNNIGQKKTNKNATGVAGIRAENERLNEELRKTLSDDDYAISKMSKADRQKVVDMGIKSQADLDGLDNYVRQQKTRLGMTVAKDKKGYYKTNDAEYNAFKDEYNQKIKDGSYSKAQRIKADYTLSKLKVGSNFSKDSRDLYNVSEKALSSWLATEEKGVDKQKLANELIAYDQALYNAGLISRLKYKGGIAAKSSGRGGKRGGGRGRKSSFSMADFTTNPQLQTQTYQNLNKLLAGTTFKGGKKPSKTGKSGKVAQKQIKVNMKA